MWELTQTSWYLGARAIYGYGNLSASLWSRDASWWKRQYQVVRTWWTMSTWIGSSTSTRSITWFLGTITALWTEGCLWFPFPSIFSLPLYVKQHLSIFLVFTFSHRYPIAAPHPTPFIFWILTYPTSTCTHFCHVMYGGYTIQRDEAAKLVRKYKSIPRAKG